MSRRFEGSKTFLKASPFFCFLYRLHQISAGWEALKNIVYLAKRVGQNLSWDYLQQYFDFRYKTMDLYNPCWFQMQGVTDLPPGIRPRKGKSLLLSFYLPLRLSLLFLYRTHAPRKIIFQARHDVVISPWGFISAEFFYCHACKKKHGHLGAIEHFSHQRPRLNKTEHLFMSKPRSSAPLPVKMCTSHTAVWTATILAWADKQAGPRQQSAN